MSLQATFVIRSLIALASGPVLLLPLLIAADAHSAQLGTAGPSYFLLLRFWLIGGLCFGSLVGVVDVFLEKWLMTLEPHEDASACLKSGSLCAETIDAHRSLVVRCALVGELYWLQVVYLHAPLERLAIALLLSFVFFHALGFALDSMRIPLCAARGTIRRHSMWSRITRRRRPYKGGSVAGLGLAQDYDCRRRGPKKKAHCTQILLPPL
jgi:hypothetical protein